MSNSTLDSLFYILVLFIVLVKTGLTWRSEHVSYLSMKPGVLSGSEIVNPEARCATTRQQEVSSLDSIQLKTGGLSRCLPADICAKLTSK